MRSEPILGGTGCGSPARPGLWGRNPSLTDGLRYPAFQHLFRTGRTGMGGDLLRWVQGSWLTDAGGRDEIVAGRRMKP